MRGGTAISLPSGAVMRTGPCTRSGPFTFGVIVVAGVVIPAKHNTAGRSVIRGQMRNGSVPVRVCTFPFAYSCPVARTPR